MAIETERKFIMRNDWFDGAVATIDAIHHAKHIDQYYLPSTENLTIRVRIINNNAACLTIKGPKVRGSASEFEYDIPLQDAREMVHVHPCDFIRKTRFQYEFNFRNYDVDVIQSEHGDVLVMAELEGDAAGHDSIFTVDVPHWAVKEVTDDPRYNNYNLAKHGIPKD